MPAVRAFRLLNAIEAGTTNGSQLQTLLGDAGRLAEFKTLLNYRGHMRRIVSGDTSIAAIVGSSIAMTALAGNKTAMDAVAESSVAKLAIFNSDSALNIVAASPVAMASLRAASQYSVVAWTENGTNNVTITLAGTSHIVLGASRSIGSVVSDTIGTVRSGSAISGTTPSLSGAPSTLAKDFDIAIPISSPRSARLGSAGTGTGYLGILRCDI